MCLLCQYVYYKIVLMIIWGKLAELAGLAASLQTVEALFRAHAKHSTYMCQVQLQLPARHV